MTRHLRRRAGFPTLPDGVRPTRRNHAAFWDGRRLTLTPAYDICPQVRAGNEASQAMLIVDEKRLSTLANCLEAAQRFQLDRATAEAVIARQTRTIRDRWDDVCGEADLSTVERNLLGRRAFLNPFVFE